MDDSQLKASLDDMKAAVLTLTDRLASSMSGLEAANAEMQELAGEMRKIQKEMAGGSRQAELPDSLLTLPLKVEATITSQARLVNTLEEMRHALGQLSLAVEASSQKGGAVKQAEGAVLQEKLSELSRTLAQSKTGEAELEAKLIPLAQLGAETLEQTRRNNEALVKLIENQNKQNDVIGETLEALLDLTEHVKARVEKLPEKKELEDEVEREVEKDIANRLTKE